MAKSTQQDAIDMKGLLRKAIQQIHYTQGSITQDKLIWKNQNYPPTDICLLQDAQT